MSDIRKDLDSETYQLLIRETDRLQNSPDADFAFEALKVFRRVALGIARSHDFSYKLKLELLEVARKTLLDQLRKLGKAGDN